MVMFNLVLSLLGITCFFICCIGLLQGSSFNRLGKSMLIIMVALVYIKIFFADKDISLLTAFVYSLQLYFLYVFIGFIIYLVSKDNEVVGYIKFITIAYVLLTGIFTISKFIVVLVT